MSLIHGQKPLFANSIQYAGLSDPGRARPVNEDCLLMLPGAGVFAVADGLGGLDAGDVASRTAMEQLSALYTSVQAAPCCPFFPLISSREAAQQTEVINACTYRRKIALGQDMATTLDMAHLCGSSVVVAHVGDSRVY